MPPKTVNALYGYDITHWNMETSVDEVKSVLSKYAKSWVFQVERGHEEDGKDEAKLHYQIRVSLKKKVRLQGLISIMSGIPTMKGCHVSATTTGVFEGGAFDYVMKEDTRVEGPWKDLDKAIAPVVIPKQIRNIVLKPFQKTVVEKLKAEPHNREINVIVDRRGGAGKGILRDYLVFNELVTSPPAHSKVEDMMAWALAFGKDKNAYMFDIPRAREKEDKKKKASASLELWRGMEVIKDGRCYDKRYKPQQRLDSRPHVWVLTNDWPPLKMLSADRWVIWGIDPKSEDLIECDYRRIRQIEKYWSDTASEQPKQKRALEKSWLDEIHLVDAEIVAGGEIVVAPKAKRHKARQRGIDEVLIQGLGEGPSRLQSPPASPNMTQRVIHIIDDDDDCSGDSKRGLPKCRHDTSLLSDDDLATMAIPETSEDIDRQVSDQDYLWTADDQQSQFGQGEHIDPYP